MKLEEVFRAYVKKIMLIFKLTHMIIRFLDLLSEVMKILETKNLTRRKTKHCYMQSYSSIVTLRYVVRLRRFCSVLCVVVFYWKRLTRILRYVYYYISINFESDQVQKLWKYLITKYYYSLKSIIFLSFPCFMLWYVMLLFSSGKSSVS